MSTHDLQTAIHSQREELTALLSTALYQLAEQCVKVMNDRHQLEQVLAKAFPELTYCKHLFVLDAVGEQVTANVCHDGRDTSHLGRNRMHRPYMQGIIGTTDFKLSQAYISRNSKRPSFTAIQVIRNKEGIVTGFLGADFDLRELPGIRESYAEPVNWRQIRGDPAIRSVLFEQTRIDSQMDHHLHDVQSIMTELMIDHGIFHGKLHLSSSRATVWTVEDPFQYRILSIEDLINPNICLAYAKHPYHERAVVPIDQIDAVFDLFRSLRFADENIYLRSGSLNVVNGMVGLNFSCDGTHYMRYDEFLSKSLSFWLGCVDSALAAHSVNAVCE